MKNRFISNLAMLTLGLSSVFSVSVLAQTTQETPAPSDQPSAPMEMGQPQSGPSPLQDQMQNQGGPVSAPDDASPNDVQPNDMQPNDAQPTEAQPGGPSGEAPAQTNQGVARLSLIHGDVSTQRGDSGDWSAATLNQPVMGGDKVSTGDSARTELQLDFANILRLGANSKANIATFTKKDIQIQLSQGLANYTVSKDSEVEPEIDTPNVALHPAHHDGVFRIEIRPDGDTVIIVRQGEAQIATPQGSTEIHAGDMATVRGDAESAQYKISPAPDRDDWDRWNSDRDHMIRNATSWRHTNRYYTGSQDLDAYGNWRNVPDYGDVWVPNEPDGWVPYRNGNWTYEPYYGWTWVGYEPWGWAPYHYGRWFPYGGAWAWWPGPVYAGYNPFWAPAYVSFWGWGGGFGFGAGWGGWGGFGWLPIGPCDFFHPWWGGYGGRFGYVGFRGGLNRFGGFAPLHGGNRFSNIANIHDNHIGRALSTLNAAHFGAGRVTAMAATRAQINGGHMMAGNLPVVPSRASLSASGRAAAPSTIRNGGSQRFFGSVHNNVARPASFQQQTASLRQSMAASHVGAIPAGGRTFSARSGESGGYRGATASGNLQRPSAGIPANRESNREMTNSGNRNAGMQSGSRPFTPPQGNTRPNSLGASERSGMGAANSGGNRDGFRPFTPPSSSPGARNGSNPPATRGSSGSYWNRTAPSSGPSSMGRSTQPGAMPQRGGSSSGGYGRGSYPGSSSGSRPQLDMRQPIVRSPSYGGYPRGGYGAPGYGGSRPGYSAPRAPSYSAPRGPSYSAPRGAPSYSGSHSSGGSHSGGGHSSGGGGHSSGGGGGHSSGGGGGGGHSGGGGGGHSGGGHSGGGHH